MRFSFRSQVHLSLASDWVKGVRPVLGTKELFYEAASGLLELGHAPFDPADGLAHATVVAVAQRDALRERSAQPSRRVPFLNP